VQLCGAAELRSFGRHLALGFGWERGRSVGRFPFMCDASGMIRSDRFLSNQCVTQL